MFKPKTLLTTLLLSFSFTSAMANETTTIIAPTSEVADGLDLYAVSEIFKDAANLEEFEADLNNPNYGINNLDLDGNGEVDYVRVVEEIVGDTHVIILQAVIWENEFQDVATIEVETSDNDYKMHVHGNEVIYGTNYYIAPSVHIHAWPIISWITRPVYRPYRSVYYWKNYPRWWKPHRPLVRKNYYLRTHKYRKTNNFVVTRAARVKKVTRVKYKPRKSVRVTKHVSVKRSATRANGNHKKVTRTTTKKVGVKNHSRPANKKVVKTRTVKKEVSRTKSNNTNKKTKTKSVKKSKTKKSSRDEK